MIELIGYVASFCVGLTLGLIGGGGAMLSIPILVYLFSVEVVAATAYSLFIVGVTSLIGSIQRLRNKLVDFRIGFLFGLPSVLSKFWARNWLVPLIPDILLQTDAFIITKRSLMLGLFSVLVIAAALSMVSGREYPRWDFGKGQDLCLASIGILIGFITGISGLGGGFIIVPTLVIIAGIPFRKAVGTTLMIIAMNSLIGFTGDLRHTAIDWLLLFGITMIAIMGILVGNFLSRQISGARLKKSFGWFILVLGLAILIKESFY